MAKILDLDLCPNARTFGELLIRSPIRRDVFLNQMSPIKAKLTANQLIIEDDPIFDLTFAEDDLKADALNVCICCDSCHSRSQKLMKRTNHMLSEFQRQMTELKNSFRKQIVDVNKQLHQMKHLFSKLLVDVQVKLNSKTSQLDKVLDISEILKHTNEYLLIENKRTKVNMERVLKENIKYRNKLGYDLKIVLNRNDCAKHLRKIAIKKKLKAIKTQEMRKNEAKANCNSIDSEAKKSTVDDSNVSFDDTNDYSDTQSLASVSSLISDQKHFGEVHSHSHNSSTQSVSPKKSVIPKNGAIKRSPQTARTRKKLIYLEDMDCSKRINGFAAHSYSNQSIVKSENSDHQNVKRVQNLESEIEGYISRYQSKIFFDNANHKNYKKRKTDHNCGNTSHLNGVPTNRFVKSEHKSHPNLCHNRSLPSKDFNQCKDQDL